jgi:hypothetical protein
MGLARKIWTRLRTSQNGTVGDQGGALLACA